MDTESDVQLEYADIQIDQASSLSSTGTMYDFHNNTFRYD